LRCKAEGFRDGPENSERGTRERIRTDRPKPIQPRFQRVEHGGLRIRLRMRQNEFRSGGRSRKPEHVCREIISNLGTHEVFHGVQISMGLHVDRQVA
jgi:hypothetical protein